jgi:hypothetical protein
MGDAKKISILQKNMPKKVKHNFKKNLIDENRAFDYLFELQIAWHFHVKGCEIQWYDEESYRHPEFLVKSPELEFNVECKRISVDISRRIRRRDFYRFAEKFLLLVEKKRYSGLIDIKLNVTVQAASANSRCPGRRDGAS